MSDRTVTVTLRASIASYQRDLAAASASTSAFGKNAGGAGKEIDKLSGRLRLATDAALILGPALGPLGAGAVGGVVALSAQLGALAGAMGVTLLAVSGLGDGLKALDKYQLEPTTENLKKLQDEMSKLGPAGEDFVRFLDSIEPNLKTLQNAAREGLLPGAQEGLEALLQRLPEVRKLIRGMATDMGDLASDAGAALAGPKFDAFFKYLRTDGIKILDDTSRTLGNLAEAAANTFAAFGGVSTDFSGGLLKFSEGLAEASANLGTNEGFIQFVDFIETEGPHALDTLGSIGNAFLQIVEATAPLGGPVLTILGKFADIIAAIADSDLGTPIFAGLAALALLNRSLALTASLQSATFGGPGVAILKNYVAELRNVSAAQQAAASTTQVELSQWDQLAAARRKSTTALVDEEKASKSRVGTVAKSAAVVGGLALATSGLAEQTGLANTANLALMGSIAGPPGAAIGAAIGTVLDYKAAWGQAGDSIETFRASLNASKGDIEAQTALVNAMREAAAKAADDVDADSFGEALKNQFDPDAGVAFYRNLLGMKSAEEQMTDAADEAAKALENKGRVSGLLSDRMTALGASTRAAAEAEKEQTAAIQDNIDAMREKRSEALRAVNAELNYQAAIDDAAAALKENGATSDKTTEKGRANRQALYALADGWNQQSDAAKNATGSLKTARQNFLDTADAMKVPQAEAKRLADRLFEIPPKRRTEVGLDGVDNAINKAEGLKAILDKLKDKDINIALHYQMLGNKPGAPPPGDPNATADGGTVPKSGRPYADRYRYLLADGEEVISNRHGQADRNRGLLKAINAGRMADGGTAGGTWTGGGGGSGGSGSSSTVFVQGVFSVTKFLHALAAELRQLQSELKKSEKSLDKERSARDDLQSQFDAIASQVGGAYSSMDPFAEFQQQASTGSVWAAGSATAGPTNALGAFDAAVAGNTASTQAAQMALEFAQSKGLDGPLYASLAASGNLPLLQQFAQLSATEIDTREQAFAAQSAAQAGLGSMAAQAEVGTQLAAANKELVGIRKEVKDLRHDVRVADQNNQAAQEKNSKDTGAAVNGAAATGHRRKKNR